MFFFTDSIVTVAFPGLETKNTLCYKSYSGDLKWKLTLQEKSIKYRWGFCSHIFFQVLESQQAFSAEASQLGEFAKDSAEEVWLLLCFVIVSAVISQSVDDLELKVLQALGFFQAMAFY